MKKFIAVLFVLMLSTSTFASGLGEMGKGECIYADNGSRKVEEVVDVEPEEVSTESSEVSSQQ